MDAPRWQRLNDLFHGVLGQASGERHAWLADRCADDVPLIDEVKRLVRAHERTNAFGPLDDSSGSPSVVNSGAGGSIAHAFRGTDRFTVRRLLGSGGMGVVYEVHDRTRDEIVALKTLQRVSAVEIYRLKREFRSLADVAHANLVPLYELDVEGDHCFFTMELVDGVGFVDYVRAIGGDALRAERARGVFRQLVHGVSELHRRGKLHRDIKPSNVLVTPDGHVVILDFGLMADLRPQGVYGSESVAGTPAYMSPEQALGADPRESSDWYSVGATLYEALVGRVPSDITERDLLADTGGSSAPVPLALDGVPGDLCAICQGLLRSDPAQRLTGADALRELDRGRSVSTATAERPPLRETTFVGRTEQLAILGNAFQSIRQGRTVTVYVSGPSGIGKSALVRRFLGQLNAHDDVLVFSGRCYEHELVRYAAAANLSPRPAATVDLSGGVLSWGGSTAWKTAYQADAALHQMPIRFQQVINESSALVKTDPTIVPLMAANGSGTGEAEAAIYSEVHGAADNQAAHTAFLLDKKQVARWFPSVVAFIQRHGV